MDTSEQYIKMCDCEEIQGGKPDLTEYGFLACPKHICLINLYHGEDTTGDSFEEHNCPTYQGLEWDACERIFIITDITAIPVKFIDTTENMDRKMAEFRSANECKEEEWVWLPRQAQLQEMVGEEYTFNLLAAFRGFYNVMGSDLYPASMSSGNPSMEQLWLAFVQKELYGKTWDGEEWVLPPLQ